MADEQIREQVARWLYEFSTGNPGSGLQWAPGHFAEQTDELIGLVRSAGRSGDTIPAGEAHPIAAQGVEAWGVYDLSGQLDSAWREERRAKFHCDPGFTVRRVRVVPVDEPNAVPGAVAREWDNPQDAVYDEAQPAEDTERVVQEYAELNETWEVKDGPTDERLSNDTHWRLVKYGPWTKLPKPAPVKPDLEDVIGKANEEWDRAPVTTYNSRAEFVAAAVRAHYEGTGE